MGDSEKEITNSKASIEEVTVEDMATKTAKPARKKAESGKTSFFAALKAEFKKIIWPNRQSLFRQTAAVILSSVCLGAIIVIIDTIVQYGLRFIIK